MQFMGPAQPAPINNTFRSPWPQNVNTAQPRTSAYLELSQLEACQLCAPVCTLTSSQLRPSPAPPPARLRHAAISAVPGAAGFTAGRGAGAERRAGFPAEHGRADPPLRAPRGALRLPRAAAARGRCGSRESGGQPAVPRSQPAPALPQPPGPARSDRGAERRL